MTFISIEYLLFLPLVVFLYFILPHKYRWLLILIASYVFYAYWNAALLILIIISTIIDYWAGLKMSEKLSRNERKPYLYVSLFVNLGMLFFFKYLAFFNESLSNIFAWLDLEYSVPEINILLPVGISFYTFQTLSYSIDVYRGDKVAEKHLGIFALYVTFFPQLVAGPIERSVSFLPQFYEKHKFKLTRFIDASKLIVWGLFKKLVIADNLAIFVNNIYDSPETYSGNMLALATYAFTIQIYCDGSGYVDIAIGSAKMLGFKLSDNYDRPLFASSISKLWRRWHISLTRWIRDYFYLPLLRRFKSNFMSYFILYLVLIVMGLWHGAGWQFVIFGLIHGTYLTLQRLTYKIRKKMTIAVKLNRFPQLKKVIDVFITFNLWAFALICFRGNNATESIFIMKNIFSGGSIKPYVMDMNGFTFSNIVIIITSVILFFVIEFINKNNLRNPFAVIKNHFLRWGVYAIVIFYILIFKANNNPDFYYFQF
jgi:D-alanyl-lipoteichoic acid acyltransferase DltB (MBOAT superfamily)